MPQPLLPLVPEGATPLCDHISIVNENDTWTYFAGVLSIFSHPREDRNSFRMFTAQLVCSGVCKQADVVKTFGVAPISVKRAVKQYREGYRPAFFRQMWREHRIACTTYHKFPKDPWPEADFHETEVTLAAGERVRMKLAERGSRIGSRTDHRLWVREVRKLTESGHQTSLISTA